MRRRAYTRNPRCRIGVTLDHCHAFDEHVAAFNRHRFAVYQAATDWPKI